MNLKIVDKWLYEIAFVVAAGATLASFVLSEVVGFIPCTLCWYQRIFMFPLPLILGAAVLRRDRLAFIYVLPLSTLGTLIALYHSLLQWGVITHETSTCSLTGSSCAKPDVLLLGFLTIPFGAFLSFSAVTALMVRATQTNKDSVFDTESQRVMQRLIVALVAITVTAVGVIELIRSAGIL